MAKFFGNLNAVMIASLVLVVITVLSLGGGADAIAANSYSSVARWLHLFFGVLWIGLLYYLNFVQVPTMPSIPDELKPAIGGHIAPKVLFYFRWSAAFTVVTGLYIAMVHGYLGEALTLKEPFRLIGVGMWMAIIMAANVWFIIWPNQKKVLGIVEADADAKAAAGKIALIASRTNTLLSLPMFYAMVNANHG